jgi:hypothetical protein
MHRHIFVFCFSLILFTVHCPLFTRQVIAADFFVSPTGSDSNPGTSINNPFQTVQKGVNSALNPGDTISVLPGTYRQTSGSTSAAFVEIMGKHGQPGKNIILKAYDAQNPPTLMGYGHAIRIVGSSYYTVDGFDITDTYHAAVTIGLADYITIQNNHIHFGFTGFCDGTETAPDPFTGCTAGAIKGRYYTTGVPIVEYDGTQNPGMHFCKTTNCQILNNHIENADEALYVGSAGNVVNDDCYHPAYNDGRLWTEANVIAGNFLENAMDEAIELKSDTRNNHIHHNVVRSTRRNWGSTMIEIRGHLNEVNNNIVVGAPVIAIRNHSENPGDPGPDRVSNYTFTRNGVLLYKSSYENYLHHNYVYYFSEFAPSGYGIVSNDTSAANRVEHNTIVGVNQFSGHISEYISIKTQATPSAIILNNLMIGTRRSSDASDTRYEYHLLTSVNYFPATSDYNAYFPGLKTNNTSCVIGFGTLGIICQNNNVHNQSVGYEYHSQFLSANPTRSDDSLCAKDQLLTLPITQLSDRIIYCSTPVPGSAILSSASDGTNIGAYEYAPAPAPLASPQPTGAGGYDFNLDGVVDYRDLLLFLACPAEALCEGGPRFTSIFDYNRLLKSL